MSNYTIGVDIGSSSSKAVILKNGREIIATEVLQDGIGSNSSKRILKKVLEKSNLNLSDIERLIVTGYGRFTFQGADKQISEISCHAKGINFLIPDGRVIIDIGGQDVKVIKLDETGAIKQFFMNDKCAAGTGRFITVMSKILDIPLELMELYDYNSDSAAAVSSTCTVFAESEVISLLSKGVRPENIVAGIHNSVAQKVSGLANRISLNEKIVFCGGVAQNYGVVRALNETLKNEITVAPNPQITGALGAAIFAYEEILNSKIRRVD